MKEGHEHVAKAVTVGINTCFFTCFLRLWRSNDEVFNMEMASK